MRLYRPFILSRLICPDAVFRLSADKKVLFLTFDDGPSPESTVNILTILGKYNVKASFFCSGQQAEKYPDLMDLIRTGGHTVGNHGYHHLNGWKTKSTEYLENIERGAEFTSTSLFRPPYGKISLSQYRFLISKYKIIMWDLMPYDYDITMTEIKILEILRGRTRKGSVIALHDKPSSKAAAVLDDFITYGLKEGFEFKKLPASLQEYS